MFATFGCTTYREQCELFAAWGIEADEPLGDVCEAGFTASLPHLSLELQPCPGCGGKSELLDVLEPVAG